MLYEAVTNLCLHKKIGLEHTRDRACGRRPDLRGDELLEGEKQMYEVEELLLEAAPGLYDELAVQAEKPRNLVSFLAAKPQRALVILDDASFRELPILELMARQTSYKVLKIGGTFAATPIAMAVFY